MRYFIVTYLRKPNGQIDEQTEVTKNIRRTHIQCASVILDFRLRRVEKAMIGGEAMPRDWDRLLAYFMQYYESIFKRLAQENGYEIELERTSQDPLPNDNVPDLAESHSQ